MKKIKIITPQYLEIEYTAAFSIQRVGAYVIDVFLLGISLFFFASISYFSEYYFYLFFLIVILYDPVCEYFMNGQTIGKKVLSIRVLQLDGQLPSLESILIRTIFRPLDFISTFGTLAFLLVSTTSKSQRLGDIFANTIVVEDKQISENDLKVLKNILSDELQIKYSLAQQLDESVVIAIKELLVRYREQRLDHIRVEIVKQASALSIFLQTEPPHEDNAVEYLTDVVRSYIHSFR